MRIQITLSPLNREYRIPLNYQYPLSASIYKLMSDSSPEFIEWLHQTGYKNANGKPYKMFTFSKLFTNSIDKSQLGQSILASSGDIGFFFSSALDEKITLSLISGILKSSEIRIGAKNLPESVFKIKDVTIEPDPEFKNLMTYKMLSPTCVSIYNGKKISYLQPSDDTTFERLADNLKNKYEVHFGEDYADEITIQPNMVNRHKSKLITIKQNTANEGHISCFETFIKIQATPKMQQLAYNVGIGERNSMGFGCLGIIEGNQ